jgi:hypothetical protein
MFGKGKLSCYDVVMLSDKAVVLYIWLLMTPKQNKTQFADPFSE